METLEKPLNRLEAAAQLGISLSLVDKLTARGQLVATKIGRRTVYQPQHLRAYLQAQTREAAVPAERDQQPPTRAQRRAARQAVAEFIDALSAGDYARADELIPATAENAVALEACGLVVRALRMSGLGAELWAQLRDQIAAD
ncbi:UNVERIFIED_ORG: uncharacterized protein YidB (DUF937 family) [Mycolicibacterium obuense]